MASSAVPEGDIWFERKHGGSRLWQDTGDGKLAFSKRLSMDNADEEDDLEALKWAALEKLPTYRRVHTAMLEAEEAELEATKKKTVLGGSRPVDVRHLARAQRERVLHKAFATTDQDNERLLKRLKQRLDR